MSDSRGGPRGLDPHDT